MPKTLDSHFSIMSTNRALQPPLPAALRPYEDVMKLLAAFSGPNCEVVLHDLSDPVHSVVRVENGEVTGRAVGQGLRHLVPNLLRMPRTDDGGLSSESPNLLPVYWLRSRGRLIRALSLLIRDDAGEVVGVLCINQDVTNVSAAAGQLQALLALLPPGEARNVFGPEGRRRPFCPAKNGFLSFVSWIRAACFLLRARSTMPQSV